MNAALEAYNNSCTYAVAVYFLNEWSVVTRCRSLVEARMCLGHWRERSSWRSKVIKLEKS
jgi:hypothetical protein